ncbi:hypothetical protein [Endozoicomonas sp. ONNA1]|uniref:hypothetical protein n=1 Tax=Endozoicomonas sp. ONNA1 TaxID=2828740 RepID=UPI002147BC79|nr:hypothetical protein [Endozoicomonas sp. ONNA1]
MKNCTAFQKHLADRSVPWSEIVKSLNVHRSAPAKWAKGVLYPNRLNAEDLIALFASHGIELDFNDIYQSREHSSDEVA